MNKVLIVAATPLEIQPLLDHFSIVVTGEGMYDTMINEKRQLNILITGVGMVNTAYQIGKYSNELFDFILNLGIAGSFNDDVKIGDVVHVAKDELIEMGAEDGDAFLKAHELNIGAHANYTEQYNINLPSIDQLKKVKGATVNKVHGNENSISWVKKIFNPDIESMEGAAFFAACARYSNYIQLRAISNKVEKRNKNNWNIPLAITNLNKTGMKIIEEYFDAN
ncbi:MAG: futalosine hydrolase [Bacteroidia bacterium]